MKIPANTKKAAIKKFTEELKAVNKKVDALGCGNTYRNSIAYMTEYMVFITKQELQVPIKNKITAASIDKIDIEPNTKTEIIYNELHEFIKKVKFYRRKTKIDEFAFLYPIKTQKYTVWVDSRKLKLLIELCEHNEILTQDAKSPIKIELNQDTLGWLVPVKVNEYIQNQIYDAVVKYEVKDE